MSSLPTTGEKNASSQEVAAGDTIPLLHPFTSASGEHITSLKILRRAKRGDMKAAAKHSKDDGEQEDFLFSRITGLTIEDLEQLDLADSKVLADRFRQMVGG